MLLGDKRIKMLKGHSVPQGNVDLNSRCQERLGGLDFWISGTWQKNQIT